MAVSYVVAWGLLRIGRPLGPLHSIEASWDELTRTIEHDSFFALGDATDHLDRAFLIRVGRGKIDLARSPGDLLALEEQPRGRWYAIRADAPLGAWEAMLAWPRLTWDVPRR
jgi:hypothetical protein